MTNSTNEKGLQLFSIMNDMPDELIYESDICITMPFTHADRPRSPFGRFMNSAWGVALLCAVISLSVVAAMFAWGRNAPPVTDPPAGGVSDTVYEVEPPVGETGDENDPAVDTASDTEGGEAVGTTETESKTESETESETETETEIETDSDAVSDMVTYTVTVTDSAGNPLPNVAVQLVEDKDGGIGFIPGLTDDAGVYVKQQRRGSYKVKVYLEGYETAEEYAYFADGAFELTIIMSVIGTETIPPSTNNDLPRPVTNLEFWIAENVDNVDFSPFQEIYGIFGGREYYGSEYTPTIGEDGQQIAPEHYVIYTITSYPDYSDSESHVTRITITDPNIEFYGITLNSSFEDFESSMQKQGFEITGSNEYHRTAEKGKYSITITKEWIMIRVEVTNDTGILF